MGSFFFSCGTTADVFGDLNMLMMVVLENIEVDLFVVTLGVVDDVDDAAGVGAVALKRFSLSCSCFDCIMNVFKNSKNEFKHLKVKILQFHFNSYSNL